MTNAADSDRGYEVASEAHLGSLCPHTAEILCVCEGRDPAARNDRTSVTEGRDPAARNDRVALVGESDLEAKSRECKLRVSSKGTEVNMDIVRDNIWLCSDCRIVACNGDVTGIDSDERIARIEAGSRDNHRPDKSRRTHTNRRTLAANFLIAYCITMTKNI